MIDDTFVFDGVCHIVDFARDHLLEGAPEADDAMMEQGFEVAVKLTGGLFDPDVIVRGETPPSLAGSVEGVYDLMFKNSPTDMAMIGNLPFAPPFVSFVSFNDPDYLRNLSHRFATTYSERCLFGGGTDPIQLGLNYAIESIDYQVREMGASTIKFYPFEWRCDDEKLAYPMYEKCRSLGIKVIQFHKSFPVWLSTNVEAQRPNDLQAPARDFPDMTFVMHHPMPLYFEETVNIAQRFPNIYLLLAPMLHLILVKPRAILHLLGTLMQQVGVDKLLYGSEGPMAGNPTRFIRAIKDLEMPKDLRDGYGYPEITDEDKAKILGLNYAALFDVDVEQRKKVISSLPAGR